MAIQDRSPLGVSPEELEEERTQGLSPGGIGGGHQTGLDRSLGFFPKGVQKNPGRAWDFQPVQGLESGGSNLGGRVPEGHGQGPDGLLTRARAERPGASGPEEGIRITLQDRDDPGGGRLPAQNGQSFDDDPLEEGVDRPGQKFDQVGNGRTPSVPADHLDRSGRKKQVRTKMRQEDGDILGAHGRHLCSKSFQGPVILQEPRPPEVFQPGGPVRAGEGDEGNRPGSGIRQGRGIEGTERRDLETNGRGRRDPWRTRVRSSPQEDPSEGQKDRNPRPSKAVQGSPLPIGFRSA